jgi:hypothetical protein
MREHNLQNVSFPDPPETFHARVCRTLADLPERKEARHMKKSVKILLTAAAVLALLATAAFAVGQLADISSRTAAGTLTELPSAGDAAQRLGVPVKLPNTSSSPAVWCPPWARASPPPRWPRSSSPAASRSPSSSSTPTSTSTRAP